MKLDSRDFYLSEPEDAWRLWHLLQKFSDALWERYEREFMDYCCEDGMSDAGDTELPF